MNDRELLELAAKAAGYECGSVNGVFKARIEQDIGTCGTYGCTKHQWRDWNPLTDDGDALRLAVKLGLLNGHPALHHEFASTVFPGGAPSDPYAATRRAIVRAAAEIGKASASPPECTHARPAT